MATYTLTFPFWLEALRGGQERYLFVGQTKHESIRNPSITSNLYNDIQNDHNPPLRQWFEDMYLFMAVCGVGLKLMGCECASPPPIWWSDTRWETWVATG